MEKEINKIFYKKALDMLSETAIDHFINDATIRGIMVTSPFSSEKEYQNIYKTLEPDLKNITKKILTYLNHSIRPHIFEMTTDYEETFGYTIYEITQVLINNFNTVNEFDLNYVEILEGHGVPGNRKTKLKEVSVKNSWALNNTILFFKKMFPKLRKVMFADLIYFAWKDNKFIELNENILGNMTTPESKQRFVNICLGSITSFIYSRTFNEVAETLSGFLSNEWFELIIPKLFSKRFRDHAKSDIGKYTKEIDDLRKVRNKVSHKMNLFHIYINEVTGDNNGVENWNFLRFVTETIINFNFHSIQSFEKPIERMTRKIGKSLSNIIKKFDEVIPPEVKRVIKIHVDTLFGFEYEFLLKLK